LRQRAYRLFLSGSYWFGGFALLLHLTAYGGYGTEKVGDGVRETVSDLWEWLHEPTKFWAARRTDKDPLMLVLTHADWELPEQLIFGAVGLAALGLVLALVASALRWRKPIPSALALLLNVVPALLSLGLIYQGRK
jgi:hypothetical protein